MPFGSKNELIQAIVDTLARPDLAGPAENWIALTEWSIERELDCTFEDAVTNGDLDGSGFLDLPADCLYPRTITIAYAKPYNVEFSERHRIESLLTAVAATPPADDGEETPSDGTVWADGSVWVDGSFWADGSGSGGSGGGGGGSDTTGGDGRLPLLVCREGNRIRYAPTGAFAYIMRYRRAAQRLASVGGAETTTYLVNLFPLLFYGALAHSAPYLKADGRIATWSSAYNTLVRQERVFQERLRYGSGPLQMRPALVL